MNIKTAPWCRAKTALLTTTGLISLAVALSGNSAQAAQAAAAQPEVEEITVTGSRIARTTFETPTPVTVVSTEQLAEMETLVSEALDDLPALNVGNQRTAGPGTGGNGNAQISLRNLGAGRTLVLIDGRRLLASSGAGAADTSLVPNNIIGRVDVVTGGASAAYGADAVAGVVNYILDKDYTGAKVSAEYGISEYGDVPRYSASFAVGAPIQEGKGHVIFSAEAYTSTGIRTTDRAFYAGRENLLPNPCAPATTVVSTNCPAWAIGGPLRYRTDDVHQANGTPGGIITAGPLKGIVFEDKGQTRMFNYGILCSTQFCLGGEGDTSPSGDSGPLPSAIGNLKRWNGFLHAQYDISDNINVFAETLYAYTLNVSHGGYPYAIGSTALTIKRDNAFLPTAIRDRMVALNLQTFSMGKQIAMWPRYDVTTGVMTTRTVVGGKVKIGDKWSGEAFFMHGYNYRNHRLPGNLDQIRYFQGVDSVIVPATGAPAGLVPGTAVCRSTLTNPRDGCIPIDPFGPTSGSPEAIRYSSTYVAGQDRSEDHYTWAHTDYSQDVISASATGEVYEGFGGGPVSVAFGGEYRWESLVHKTDPYSQIISPVTNVFGGWRAGNQLPFEGKLNVNEFFTEAVVPIAKGAPVADYLEVNAAARRTDYSTSGVVYTWKVGVLYNPISDVRLRLTRSRDIRAPTANNLFQAGSAGTANLRDPFQGNAVVAGVKTVTRGNPTLRPEVADTLVYGVVFQPTWLEGFSLAVDRWEIDIKDSIASVGNQNVLDQCFANQASDVCAFIIRDNTNRLNAIDNKPFNFAFANTDGIDIEATLRRPIYSWMPVVGDGDFTLRALFTNTLHNTTQTPGEVPNEGAGEVGQPKWLGVGQFGVTKGSWRGFLQAKYIGPVVYDNIYKSGVDINDNSIGDVTYFSGRLSYEFDVFGSEGEISLGINNLLDRKPPLGQAGGDYDEVGRNYRLTLNFRF